MLRRSRSVSEIALVALVGLSIAGCNPERAARRELESDGYTEVTLTKTASKTFSFTARNASQQHCTGDVAVSGGSVTVTSMCSDVCTKTESTKCFSLAEQLEKTDPTKATQYYVIGCEAGDAASCVNAGVAYGKGTGVTADDVQSFVYDKKGCDGGDPQGCVNLGIDYEEGLGTPKDLAAAFRVSDAACTKKNMAGCSMSGRLLITGKGVPPDVIQGVDRLDRACTGDVIVACTNLGSYLVEGTHGVTRDTKRGQDLLEAACAKNEATACSNLGLYFMQKRLSDPTGAKMIADLTKGCDGKEGAGCNTLAYVTENGLGGLKADLAQALVTYQRGCDFGHGLACRNVGLFHQFGRGTTKDLTKAAAAYDAGCKLGDDKSCIKRKELPI